MLAVVDSVQVAGDISGAVAEIGVHHGRLFIGLSLLQRKEKSVAIDVFGDQELNVDQSGKGDLAIFSRNVQRWSSLDSVVIHQGDSTQLQADQLRDLAQGSIRMFSVDGGHTDQIVYSDMNLAEGTLAAGGVVIADDVFNQEWPGVSTGTLRYMSNGGKLVPFAIGFNKVLFSLPEYATVYQDAIRGKFDDRYLVFTKMSEFADHEVLILGKSSRQPRQLISRNQTAKNFYHRIQRWRGVRPGSD